MLFSAKYIISILNGIFNRLFRGGKNIKKTFGSWGMDRLMYHNDGCIVMMTMMMLVVMKRFVDDDDDMVMMMMILWMIMMMSMIW